VLRKDVTSEESAPIYVDAIFNADAKADSLEEVTEENHRKIKGFICSSHRNPFNLVNLTHLLESLD
jgi:hypothetical protein